MQQFESQSYREGYQSEREKNQPYEQSSSYRDDPEQAQQIHDIYGSADSTRQKLQSPLSRSHLVLAILTFVFSVITMACVTVLFALSTNLFASTAEAGTGLSGELIAVFVLAICSFVVVIPTFVFALTHMVLLAKKYPSQNKKPF